MKAYLIRFYGRVQRVGFRRFVQEIAQDLGLSGYIKNERDGSVTIFAQGDEEAIAKLIEAAKSPPPPAYVKSIDEKEAKPRPKIKFFEIRYGKLADELQEGFGAMQSIFMDYWSEFRDYRQEFHGYAGEFRDFRQEFRDFRQEFGDFRQEFGDFAKRTDENFKVLIEMYNGISEKITRIMDMLVEESKKTRELLEAVHKDSIETREMLNETMRILKAVAERILTQNKAEHTH